MPDRYFFKNTGLIDAKGKDTIDFLNRMSTNDLSKFPQNEFRKTVLTTDKGRIIDLITILNQAEKIIILTTPDSQEKVRSHLDKYIIMDDVELNVSEKNIHIVVFARDVKKAAEELFNITPEKNKIYALNENDILFIDDFKKDSLNVICRESSADHYKVLLKNFSEMSFEEYETERINAGIAEGVNELNEHINPVECGLNGFISYKKGCYIGQEVIARLDSQGKIPKVMVRISSDNELRKDDKIFLDTKETGFISSAVSSEGKYLALGFIRGVNLDMSKEYFASHAVPGEEGIKTETNGSLVKLELSLID